MTQQEIETTKTYLRSLTLSQLKDAAKRGSVIVNPAHLVLVDGQMINMRLRLIREEFDRRRAEGFDS